MILYDSTKKEHKNTSRSSFGMMIANQELDLVNQLSHSAFKLKCHDQQCQKQQ